MSVKRGERYQKANATRFLGELKKRDETIKQLDDIIKQLEAKLKRFKLIEQAVNLGHNFILSTSNKKFQVQINTHLVPRKDALLLSSMDTAIDILIDAMTVKGG